MSHQIDETIKVAQTLIDQGMSFAAQQLLKEKGLKCKIVDGTIIDDSDQCEIYLKKFLTRNDTLLTLKDHIKKLSHTDHEVLITGPTGTGKELLAHALQGRREGAFKAINCAGLPDQLVESELFGHEKGAFTGAYETKSGLMQIAAGGTIFLDEISELPITSQGKLLRAIQSKVVRKVGAKQDEKITCRFVCASNRDLMDMCRNHLFRLDLYARISTFELRTLSLSDRPDDIPLIYEGLGAPVDLIKHVVEKRTEHPFNVRSIEQNIKRYKVLNTLP